MMQQEVRVIPASQFQHSRSLRQDCEVVTELLQRMLRDDVSASVEEVWQQLQLRVDEVCHFPWERMTLLNDSVCARAVTGTAVESVSVSAKAG